MKAAVMSIKVKAQGAQGIDDSDLQPLKDAMEKARSQGLDDDSFAMKAVLKQLGRFEKQIKLQAEMKAFIDGENPDESIFAKYKAVRAHV